MDMLSTINTRSSAIKLTAPGPSRSDLEKIMLAGTRAPDHGKLAPWRFVVLEQKGIGELGDAMAESLRRRIPGVTEAQLDGEKQKPKRAPTIIVVAAHPTRGHKVPVAEQVMAVAAAVENMILAAHALGHGTMWKTGEAARDSFVKQTLGLDAEDEIVAFLYLGTITTAGPVRAGTLEGKVTWLR